MSTVERMNPDGMYKPNLGVYSQVTKSTGGTIVHVAGTVAMDKDGNLVGKGDIAAQAKCVWDNLVISLKAAGATPADVVKINSFVTDVDDYIKHIGPLLQDVFGDKRPVSTLVEVSRLVNPDWLVEIEATAIID